MAISVRRTSEEEWAGRAAAQIGSIVHYYAGQDDSRRRIAEALLPFKEMARGEASGITGSVEPIWREFADEGAAVTFYFGCEAPLRDENMRGARKLLSFSDDANKGMENLDVRRFFCFQARKAESYLFARVWKAMFFAAILESEGRNNPETRDEMPLVAYVADEFHNFVTSDPEHGEQYFLDRARSYGAFTVLACQSVESLKDALANAEANEIKVNSAVAIIFNNTANKFFFRSTDPASMKQARGMIPKSGNQGHVMDQRPLSLLKQGQCYMITADGRIGLVQLEGIYKDNPEG